MQSVVTSVSLMVELLALAARAGDDSAHRAWPDCAQPCCRPLPSWSGVAARRAPRQDGGVQGCIVVGAGGWRMSYLEERVVDAGGERVMVVSPGDYERLLAGIAWLAGQDEMIAPSAVSQQVSRLDGITPAVRTRWRWIAVVVMPGGCLMLGAVVWFIRRR